MSLRRILGAALSGVVVTGLVSVVATPTASASTYGVEPTSWSYVDSTAPTSAFLDPDELPVGAEVYANGTTHVTKSYVTFDVSAYRALPLVDARLRLGETSVRNCAKTRQTQVWLAATTRKPTWNNQPGEQLQVPFKSDNAQCPSYNTYWDASDAVRQAIAAGRTKVTFAVRMPDAVQTDPAYGRAYGRDALLAVDVNHAPGKPTNLSLGYLDLLNCTSGTIESGSLSMHAIAHDQDGDYNLHAQFDWWPVDHPEQRHSIDTPGASDGSGSTADIPHDQTVEGGTYAWQVRVADAFGPGPWSAICEFTLDTAKPVPPAVTSTDYPPATSGPGTGGSGIAGAFTFTANGVADVAKYQYQLESGFQVFTAVAARKGGPATVRIVPDHAGADALLVRSYDDAGNYSEQTRYPFVVASTAPAVTCTPIDGYIGQERTCTATPGPGGATEYVYSYNYGVPVAVPAGADGSATFTITPTDLYDAHRLAVHAVRLDGGNSDDTTVVFGADPAEPVIDAYPEQVQLGDEVTLTFHAVLPDSQYFDYLLDSGDRATVPVGPDGSATVTIPMLYSGLFDMDVYSVNSAGVPSGRAVASIIVATNAPTVTSDVYPAYDYGGGPGVAGTFTFRSSVPGAVSFVYALSGEANRTVQADADGSASVVITPPAADAYSLHVNTKFADGTMSEDTVYVFYVASGSFAGKPDAGPTRRVAA